MDGYCVRREIPACFAAELVEHMGSRSICQRLEIVTLPRDPARRGRGPSESTIMAKGTNSRKETKKPKKDKSKDKAKSAADSNKSSITIGGKTMK